MPSPRLSYIICTNPRSGSWLLADGLRDTGRAGFPREWFQEEEEEAYSRRWGIPRPTLNSGYEQYLNRALQAGMGQSDIFGMKCMHYQFKAMPAKLATIPRFRGLPIEDILPQAFSNLNYIWLIRRDKVRQAVSYHRAVQTQVWCIVESQKPGDTSRTTYDAASIERFENLLRKAEAGWEDYFSRCRQKPLIIYYEDLIQDFRETVYQSLAHIGLENYRSIRVPPAHHKKMADALTDEWVERYLDYKRNRTTMTVSSSAASASSPDSLALPDTPALKTDSYATGPAAAPITDPLASQLLPKRQAYAMIQRQLMRHSPKRGIIERRWNLSRNEFLNEHYAVNRPVIITGAMENWAARTRWTPDYLKAACGDAMVEIMADRNKSTAYETDVAKHRRTVRFGEFVDMVEAGGATNDYYLTARNNFFKNSASRQLLQDIEIFPEYLDGTADWMFLWYGPKGTVTPLHHDLMNIFMAQVKGHKRIRMIPAAEMDLVYNNNGVYSPIDIENPDYNAFPRFRDATVIDLELAPGEVLFLPVGWWHHVRALDTSITVSLANFLWSNHFEWAHPKLNQ